jgi:hypothetical protein
MIVMRPHLYEITFTGRAGSVLREEFGDCEVSVGADSTTLRANLPDQAALFGVLHRISIFALELTQVRILPADEAASTTPPPADAGPSRPPDHIPRWGDAEGTLGHHGLGSGK